VAVAPGVNVTTTGVPETVPIVTVIGVIVAGDGPDTVGAVAGLP
jgi:hypothetical protein